MKVRVPKIIEETQALNPESPAPIQRALAELRESIENDGPIPMIEVTAYLSSKHEPVHFIADNAGTELAADLAFVDALLAAGTRQVIYHVKMHPTFVSDSTVHDVVSFVERMKEHSQPIQGLGRRLR